MENLIIEVTHNKELFCKITKYNVKKLRKKYLFFAIFSAVMAVALLLSNTLLSAPKYTMMVGYLFIIACGLFVGSLARLSSKAIARSVDKNMEAFPINSKYTFLEDKFLLETKYQTSHSKSEYEYASISSLNRIDEKTLYLSLKNNIYCIIESNKCDEIVAWINSRNSN